MSLELITAPSALPVTWEEVVEYLHVTDGAADGATISTLMSAATDAVAAFIGRQLVSAGWRLKLDCFPCRVIELPLPPCISVDAIAYIDTNGDTQTLAESTDWSVTGLNADCRAELFPALGKYWPSPARQPGSVTIDFTAGYAPGEDDPAENIPAAIKSAILATILASFDGQTSSALPPSAIAALRPYKLASF